MGGHSKQREENKQSPRLKEEQGPCKELFLNVTVPKGQRATVEPKEIKRTERWDL